MPDLRLIMRMHCRVVLLMGEAVGVGRCEGSNGYTKLVAAFAVTNVTWGLNPPQFSLPVAFSWWIACGNAPSLAVTAFTPDNSLVRPWRAVAFGTRIPNNALCVTLWQGLCSLGRVLLLTVWCYQSGY